MAVMKNFIFMLRVLLLINMLPCAWLAGDESGLAGYSNQTLLESRLRKIVAAHPEQASLHSLGRTLGQRDIWLLKCGAGQMDDKPALLIVGSVKSSLPQGAELALGVAEKWLESERGRKLLQKFTLYILPTPTPDASAHLFAQADKEGVRLVTSVFFLENEERFIEGEARLQEAP